MNRISAADLYKMYTYAAVSLGEQAESVNALNVFPVPDGDTGSNMSMTISGVNSITSDKLASVGECAKAGADLMLRSARGNSGVILSVFFKGLAQGLAGLDTAAASDLPSAFAKATEAAYGAVVNPTEGTILTVMRAASESIASYSKDSVDELFKIAIDSAKIALDNTPEQLPLLKEAGVVDAGGCGFMIILSAMYAVISGDVNAADFKVPEPAQAVKNMSAAALCDSEIVFPYCTECVIEKNAEGTSDADALRTLALSIGDSVVFVEDESIIKLHVHTGDPGAILTEAVKYGMLLTVKIENMRNQHTALADMPQSSVAQGIGFVSVCSGDGLLEIFKDLGADEVVSGGQTMNPSTDDILDAVKRVEKSHVFVLPNNSNIILTASEAAKLAEDLDIIVEVIPSKTIPQGITAMYSFDPDQSFDDNASAMKDSLRTVRSASVTHAVRDASIDGLEIKKGQFIGLVEGKVRYSADSLYSCVEKLVYELEGKECVTVYCGEEISASEMSEVRDELEGMLGSDVDVTVISGGQPVYSLILSAE